MTKRKLTVFLFCFYTSMSIWTMQDSVILIQITQDLDPTLKYEIMCTHSVFLLISMHRLLFYFLYLPSTLVLNM